LPVVLEHLPAGRAELFLIGLQAIQDDPVALVEDLTAKPARIAAAGLLAALPHRVGLRKTQRRSQPYQYSEDQGTFQHFHFSTVTWPDIMTAVLHPTESAASYSLLASKAA
jgi:hypothetical protein